MATRMGGIGREFFFLRLNKKRWNTARGWLSQLVAKVADKGSYRLFRDSNK
ncbi:hypothetical protein HYR99_41395 [Candidatus Poribacteria bacterium]|nr:hypothetical protein [Candidatus Poribacteria bacterium]